MGRLDVDTSLVAVGDTFEARIPKDWTLASPSGGFVSALALRAVGERAVVRRPASISVTYVGLPTLNAPLVLSVSTLKPGKRAEVFRVGIHQDGRTILEAHVWTCEPTVGLEHDLVPAPQASAPEQLLTGEELPPELRPPPFPFWKNFDARRDHWTLKRPPRMGGWFKYRPQAAFEDPFVDAARPLILLDTLVFGAALGPHPGLFAPSLSLDVSVHYHRSAWPLSDWLYADVEAPIAVEGRIAGRGRIWDSAGKLVASGSSQMLSLGPPQPRP